MPPIRPIVTLTTDFGLSDPFVGIMKGVIAGVCPAAHVIDLTHGVAAFNVLDGALAVWQSWRYFPSETVHVVVVDPGVGSERHPVLARMGSHWFVAPDNGVLTLVEREVVRAKGSAWHRQIKNLQYMLPVQSHTFHGRDIFAPAAAHLAGQIERGKVAAETFGPVIESLVRLEISEPVYHPDGSIDGVILKSDRFGNLLTNVPASELRSSTEGWVLEMGAIRIERFVRFYGEGEPGEIFAIPGSSGLLEIAMNRGSAREETGIHPGRTFRVIPASRSRS